MSTNGGVIEHCAQVCAARAWRLANRMLSNPADADDAVQQALLVATSNPERIPEHDPWPWFAGVVRNVSLKILRSRSKAGVTVEAEPVEDEDTSDPSGLVESSEFLILLREALKEIPLDEREALALKYISGISYRQASRETGIPFNTLVSRSQRGLRRLREKLSPHAFGNHWALAPFVAIGKGPSSLWALIKKAFGFGETGAASTSNSLTHKATTLSLAPAALFLALLTLTGVGIGASALATGWFESSESESELTGLESSQAVTSADELNREGAQGSTESSRSAFTNDDIRSSKVSASLAPEDYSSVDILGEASEFRSIEGTARIATRRGTELEISDSALAGALVWVQLPAKENADKKSSTSAPAARIASTLSDNHGHWKLSVPLTFKGEVRLFHPRYICCTQPPEETLKKHKIDAYPASNWDWSLPNDEIAPQAVAEIDSESDNLTLAAEVAAFVEGKVVDLERSNPVGSALINLSWPSRSLILSSQSDEKGSFRLGPLLPGFAHTLSASCEGFQPYIDRELIPRAGIQNISVKLMAQSTVPGESLPSPNDVQVQELSQQLRDVAIQKDGRISVLGEVKTASPELKQFAIEVARRERTKVGGNHELKVWVSEATAYIGRDRKPSLQGFGAIVKSGQRVMVTGIYAQDVIYATEVTEVRTTTRNSDSSGKTESSKTPAPPKKDTTKASDTDREGDDTSTEAEDNEEDQVKDDVIGDTGEEDLEPLPEPEDEGEESQVAPPTFSTIGVLVSRDAPYLYVHLTRFSTIGDNRIEAGATVGFAVSANALLSHRGTTTNMNMLPLGSSCVLQGEVSETGVRVITALTVIASTVRMRVLSVGYGLQARYLAMTEILEIDGQPYGQLAGLPQVRQVYFGWHDQPSPDDTVIRSLTFDSEGMGHADNNPFLPGGPRGGFNQEASLSSSQVIAGSTSIDVFGYLRFNVYVFDGSSVARPVTIMVSFDAEISVVENNVTSYISAFEALAYLDAPLKRIHVAGIPTTHPLVFDATNSLRIVR